MRKRLLSVLALLIFLYVMVKNAEAKTDCSYMVGTGMYQVEATAYCDSAQPTASGELVRDGICAFAPELMHKTIALYDTNKNLIRYLEVKDTGSKRIRNGEVIDIWMSDYDDCIEWGRQKVYIEVIDAEG